VPALFVHGVPDTDRVWHAILPRLDRRDVVTLQLPGFGRPAPVEFPATHDAYAAGWWSRSPPSALRST
jgi:pimeloyl-ACP methyl ester carboxylesterase